MAGKSSAVAEVAAQAGPDQGRAVAHSRAPGDGAPGDQADLLAFGDELALFEGQAVAPPRRGPGRPVGSVNRTTLQLQRLLMARGARDPAEFLASLVSMDARELARELSREEKVGDATVRIADVRDAVDLQIKAARELMPYFHQKMPIAVQHSGDGQRPLIMIHNEPAAGPAVAVRGDAMSVHDVEPIQGNQGVSEGAATKSHDAAGG